MTTGQTDIRVQSVLYQPYGGTIERFLRGIGQAAQRALQSQPSLTVQLCLGDCSPTSSMDASSLEQAEADLKQTGLASFSYQFFGANLGHGGGQNELLKARDGARFVLILNPDTCAGPGLLLELLEAMRDPSVGIAEGRQLPLEHQKAYDLVSGDTSWASGACSFVRAEVFESAGSYDSNSFFLYCDDVDLSWRARLAGYRVVLQPSARVFHDKRISLGGSYIDNANEKYYSALASLTLAWKYSRPDVVASGLEYLEGAGEPILLQAAAQFRDNELNGRLPEPIDPEGKVGQFNTYAFADVRF